MVSKMIDPSHLFPLEIPLEILKFRFNLHMVKDDWLPLFPQFQLEI